MPSEVVSLTDEDVISLWIRKNRGVCSQISRDCDVSAEFVRRILYGIDAARSVGLHVEKALIEAGAPFVADRIAEVA